MATFMDACYIARRNAITGPALEHFQFCVRKFHTLRNIFIDAGVRASISLPRQHALLHYFYSIHLFGSPNGLCSSITESKHIKAVKEPWRRSSRYHALIQMLQTLVRMDKMATLRRTFAKMGMLAGTTSSYMAQMKAKDSESSPDSDEAELHDEENDDDDGGPASGNPSGAMSDVKLASKCGMYNEFSSGCLQITDLFAESRYPRNLYQLAEHIHLPNFPLALRRFLFMHNHPNQEPLAEIENLPSFEGEIRVYHSAVAIYHAPSDLCGAGGLYRECIRSTPLFHGHEHRDTVFVVLDELKCGMEGMEIGRILLFFSFHYRREKFSCALINWFIHDEEPDRDTGMWTVQLERDRRGQPTIEVIDIDTIARGAHLLPVYGSSRVPDDFSHHDALDSYNSFFVNHFIDHHAHEFITTS
jgi:hypothetical protein